MRMMGVRGAITVDENTEKSMLQASQYLLEEIIKANDIAEEDVASIMFSTTPDLTACYPARAARIMGWHQTALMGFQETDVPTGLKMCIRILIHWNTEKDQTQIVHKFMGGAAALRPDLAEKQEN